MKLKNLVQIVLDAQYLPDEASKNLLRIIQNHNFTGMKEETLLSVIYWLEDLSAKIRDNDPELMEDINKIHKALYQSVFVNPALQTVSQRNKTCSTITQKS